MSNIKEKDTQFEHFLMVRNDAIDNAVYALLRLMQALPEQYDNSFPWNTGEIGGCEDAVESFMRDSNIKVCHPYYSEAGTETSEYENPNGLPCYRAGNCEMKDDCPFLKAISAQRQ